MKKGLKSALAILLVLCVGGGAVIGCKPKESEKPTLALSCESDSIVAEETAQMVATVTPENLSDKSVLWSIKGPAGTIVSPTGLITAGWTEGVATVTGKLKADRSVSATRKITIAKKVVDGDKTFDSESPKNDGFKPASATGNISVNSLSYDRAEVTYTNLDKNTQYHNVFTNYSTDTALYNVVNFRIKNTGESNALYVVKIVDSNGWEYSGGTESVAAGVTKDFSAEIQLTSAGKGDNTIENTKANGIIQSLIIFPDSYREEADWKDDPTFSGSFLIWNIGLVKGDVLEFTPSISVTENADIADKYQVEFLSNSKVALSNAAYRFVFESGLIPNTIDFTIDVKEFQSSTDNENFTDYTEPMFVQIVYVRSLEGELYEHTVYSTFTPITADGTKFTVTVPNPADIQETTLAGFYFFVAGKDEANKPEEGKTVYKGKFDLTMQQNYGESFTVTAPESVVNGSVEVAEKVIEGGDLDVKFKPVDGYAVASAKINGVTKYATADVAADGILNHCYVVENVAADVEITDVVFEKLISEKITGITYEGNAVTKEGITLSNGNAVLFSTADGIDLIKFAQKGTRSHIKVTASSHTATKAGLEHIQLFYNNDGGMTGWQNIADTSEQNTVFYIACADVTDYITLQLVENGGKGSFDLAFEYVDYIAASVSFTPDGTGTNKWTANYQFIGKMGYGAAGNELYIPFEADKTAKTITLTIEDFTGKRYNAAADGIFTCQIVARTGDNIWADTDWNTFTYVAFGESLTVPTSATAGMAFLLIGQQDVVHSGSFTLTVTYTY